MKIRRINLEIPEDTAKGWDKLQERMHASSRTEMIKRAMTVLNELKDHQAIGGRWIKEYPDGKQERMIYLI